MLIWLFTKWQWSDTDEINFTKTTKSSRLKIFYLSFGVLLAMCVFLPQSCCDISKRKFVLVPWRHLWYVCMYACIYVIMHESMICVCMYACMYVCIYVCMHAWVCMHAFTSMWVCIMDIYMYECAYMHVCKTSYMTVCMDVYNHKHACVHISMHACIIHSTHAYIHTCVYICVRACHRFTKSKDKVSAIQYRWRPIRFFRCYEIFIRDDLAIWVQRRDPLSLNKVTLILYLQIKIYCLFSLLNALRF